ncbi:bifunctional methylenetetrahydrofolate dehydrogenase/methenyltetrahydrofolate cyclohydrolase FolD [Candidatus Oleimmundimicrobium sp.]|uniref:bifunctional methylenetetrahydrofolate dehydrogenase/methenyltetrahydrofolate cyclohydrolase FolD n=1 Tax=Candidatus Oleimmundimicrobium sp. TaxID=3060597 RepID=UPI0027174C88|nr:bifunctional methylenetetrahydrofolate dehydrogenase/methenyltetrahydrofolate cyclohydrolase FolD [Candidatus Oleimmundimicrobium sp.]MDO8886253.1 bifunctional methylenetetrahydrofolate dehydrogenase/methenyltetrahydrofolate cyclohydrolase FolD [Candidatus Oleimmundimicrobium sp.]
MSAKIIDGKAIAASIRQDMVDEVAQLKKEGITPGLAVVIVGDDPASKVYVGQKEKGCAQVGIYSEKYALPADTSEEELLALVSKLNIDDKINGILVQLPLPKQIDEKKILYAISPVKDVDGFHPENIGKLVIGEDAFLPCTPHGIMVLLKHAGIDLRGKEAVVVGRSNIVGKPISLMLLSKSATVTICHSKTKDLSFHTKRADVLVAAVGKPEMIKGEMVKDGVIVIDVGVNRLESGKLVGDVEFESVSKKALVITPVPGGVGPMTITMLLKNTIKAAKMQA